MYESVHRLGKDDEVTHNVKIVFKGLHKVSAQYFSTDPGPP